MDPIRCSGQAEQDFIQACLDHLLYPDRPLSAPPDQMDWARAYELLSRHGLTRVFYRLATEEGAMWPESFRQRLRADYEVARLWGELWTRDVQEALAALEASRIPVLVLKGWALIPGLYGGDPGLRVCGDLDLLLRPADAARAERLMESLGYGARLEPWRGFDRRYRNCRPFWRLRQPWPFQDTFAVALHWSLLDTPFFWRRMEVQSLFERSVPMQVAGVEARSMGIEDHLVYACGHLALHHDYDEALVRTYEMASLILRGGSAVDWTAVEARAAEWRLVLPTRRVLARLDGLWPGIVPGAALERISALSARWSERLVHGWVVQARQNHTSRVVLAWLTMPGFGRRWRYLFEAAIPGPDYLRERYGRAPGGVWPLHYLRRFGLAVRYAAGRKRPARGDPSLRSG